VKHRPVNRIKLSAIFTLALLASSLLQAQTVYRVVGPDGKVTFSDKPPVSSANVTATSQSGRAMGIGGPSLPFELRQVVSRFPVTLYTASNCAPCSAGRALLGSRGVPFTEKTVTTAEDSEALVRISGENSLPFLTIGAQQIRGYSDTEWTQFLNAAGYPNSSVLPANFRNPAATPLVALQEPAEPKAENVAAPRATNQPERPAPRNESNPAGITF
jgi:glutaredoxin